MYIAFPCYCQNHWYQNIKPQIPTKNSIVFLNTQFPRQNIKYTSYIVIQATVLDPLQNPTQTVICSLATFAIIESETVRFLSFTPFQSFVTVLLIVPDYETFTIFFFILYLDFLFVIDLPPPIFFQHLSILL